MRYMLINVSNSNLQVDLYDPDVSHKNRGLHRIAPSVALSLKKGEGKDILPYFKGSLEKTHDAVLHSRDVLKSLKPSVLSIFVCDDAGKEINADRVLGREPFSPQYYKMIEAGKEYQKKKSEAVQPPPPVKVEEEKIEKSEIENIVLTPVEVKIEELKVEKKVEELKVDKKKPTKKGKK